MRKLAAPDTLETGGRFMKPRIAAITGKLEDTVISMAEGPVLIGRQAGATLKIGNASVSRRHAIIERDGDRFIIADLGSRNGTFVNDVPVRRRELQHGDRVRIGDSQFFFLYEETDEPDRTSEIRFDDSEITSGATVRRTYADAVGLMARDLATLLKVSTSINSICDLEELEERLLELIFEVVPAKHGAILLLGDEAEITNQFTSVFGLDRVYGSNQKVIVSSTVVRRVLKDNAALLITDAEQTEALQSESLISAHSRSLLCVPLIVHGKSLGVIYLDSDVPDVRFDEDHLQLITAVAAIAAVAIQNAKHIKTLESENQRLIADANIQHNMIGESDLMQQVYHLITKVATTDSTVLISGESGTGKELAARAVHTNSRRSAKPFVAVNCAALAESLLESELFGHEKGAFTGALNQRKGRLEFADGGTLFLDEIAELSPALQTKLLRVLQEREFERVGGNKPTKVDIRVIAATNQDLNAAIASGAFRQDLFFRLNVVELKMPALRDRAEDIPMLGNYFAAKYADKCNRRVVGISPEAQKLLQAYDWPGNVRELENAIERAVVMGSTEHILSEDLPEPLLEAGAPHAPSESSGYHNHVTHTKKQIILEAMKKSDGNYTEAAKLLGLHPNYLHRLVKNLNLKQQLN
ncbi:MAG TPA: sigma 54-interacting transcriptional regulator [Pyrinomonadaceae bacterium]|jgi:Nif-specific regulatory protein|nr:sigma 54-interacting transcriptional regulator [Pyrinomonadaceae bacterium]